MRAALCTQELTVEIYQPILFLAAVFAGILILFFVLRVNFQNKANRKPKAAHPAVKRLQRPAPIPEDPNESQKLLQLLKANEIYFEDFGKIARVHGKLIYGILVEEKRKGSIWMKLTELLPETDYWPLFVAQNVFSIQQDPGDITYTSYAHPEDIIRLAKKRPFEPFLTRIEDSLADRLDLIDKGEYWGAAHIPDPNQLPSMSKESSPSRLIAFAPTPHSWQAPAYFSMGNTLSLKDEEMLVVLKHWEDLYGAKVYFFTPNLMELRTSRRPESEEEALRLAYEQSFFCGDLYQRQYTNPEELAADLMRKNDWEFWWD
jgi:hypothetical protein